MSVGISVPPGRTASRVQLHAVGGVQNPSHVWPVLSWRSLHRDSYRAALKCGALRCGVYVEEPLHRNQPTVIFIHGAGGAPSQFAPLAAALNGRVNRAIFLWDDTARLAPAAERLRAAVLQADDAVTIVAHSMGTLLPAYIGATDPHGCLRRLAVTYLNPLVGGSRHAGDFRALRWLGVGRLLQRVLVRPSFLDLAPESEFQQTICGRMSAPSSFAAHTVLLFTERRGQEPDIRPARVPAYFGRTRDEVLVRLGTVRMAPPRQANGHIAPLRDPSLVLPILETLLAGSTAGDRRHVQPG